MTGVGSPVDVEARPFELILARNLISSLDTAALITDQHSALLFYNDTAAELLERRCEEVTPCAADVWELIGPYDRVGTRISLDELPLAMALRRGEPARARLMIRTFCGNQRDVEVSAVPLVTALAGRGAIVLMWPADR